ncbi:MAG: RNA polymerase sigma-70 factor [Bacteroidota bacterium]
MEAKNEHSDKQLLDLLKEDNRIAFNELYLRYWEGLYQFAYSVLRIEDASKDVVQDVFFNIWSNRTTQSIDNLQGYLFSSVRFEVIRQLKNGSFTVAHEEYLEEISSGNEVEERINLKELEEKLKAYVETLPEKRKVVFTLSRFKGLSNKEIAEKLDISQRTVEWHISNALNQLRQNFDKVATLLLICSF